MYCIECYRAILPKFVQLAESPAAAAAAAAAKSLQLCPTLCDPIDGSPPGSSVHGILQARILECGSRCSLESAVLEISQTDSGD